MSDSHLCGIINGMSKIVLALKKLLFKLRPVSIRDRLLLAFLLMVLIPAIAFGAVSAVVGLQRGREQVIDKLNSVAVLKEDELVAWTGNVQADLESIMLGEGILGNVQFFLHPSTNREELDPTYEKLHQLFSVYVDKNDRFDELFLVNLNRLVVLSTDRQREGLHSLVAAQAFFDRGLEGGYLYPPSYTLATLTGSGVGINVMLPVYDDAEQLLGILVGRTSPTRLSNIMLERTGLGETGETFLVARNFVMLTEPRIPVKGFMDSYYVFSEATKLAIEGHVNGSGVYKNHRGVKVVGVYRWLPTLKVALLAEQAEHEAMATVYQTLAINAGVAVAAALVAGYVALSLARSINAPLSSLVQTASMISDGQLELIALVERNDELGALAQAFNKMTKRLGEMINTLDIQVKERTQTLQRRALQLQTSMQVSRDLSASILNIDELLSRVVELIRKTFDYYFVGIFLADANGKELIFQAGNSRAEQEWADNNRKLAIGEGSLNGEVAQSKQVILVNDVSLDIRYREWEGLPDTRSELIVPLLIGDRLIGTLDVQSSEVDDFSQDDLQVVQSLGEQVAIAIENARLYDQSRELAVMEERNRLARDLHDAVSQILFSAGLIADVLPRAWNANPELGQELLMDQRHLIRGALAEMRILLSELRPESLVEANLCDLLEQLADTIVGRTGWNVKVMTNDRPELPSDIKIGLYRIAQEALNNAARHSGASKVFVNLRTLPSNYLGARSEEKGRLELSICDDGCGFEPGRVSSDHLGLGIMRERAASIGAKLNILTEANHGTTVLVTWQA